MRDRSTDNTNLACEDASRNAIPPVARAESERLIRIIVIIARAHMTVLGQ